MMRKTLIAVGCVAGLTMGPASGAQAAQMWGAAYDASYSNTKLFRFDTSGNVVWQRNYGNAFGYFAGDIAQTPNGNLYVTGANSNLYRLNPSNGDIIDSWNVGGFYNALVADGDDTLYFLDNTNGSNNNGYLGTITLDGSGNYDSHSYDRYIANAPDADLEWYDGNLLGTFWGDGGPGSDLYFFDEPGDGTDIGTPVQTDLLYIAGLAWADDVLYAGSWNNNLNVYSLDPTTGNVESKFDFLDDLDGMYGITGLDRVSAVPIPPAALLFGSALIGLAAIGRRKPAQARA